MALTDEQLRAFVPRNYFLKEPYNAIVPEGEEKEEVTTSYGIPNTNAFVNSGGGNNYTGSASNLIGDFNRATTERQAKLNAYDQNRGAIDVNPADAGFYVGAGKDIPRKRSLMQGMTDFMYDKVPGINRPQSYEDIMEKGYQKPRGVMPGIIGLMNKFGIQNFASLPQADQAFIISQKGYTGPTVFGEIGSNMGHSIDPFGMNVESLFGNYARGVQKDYDKLSDYFGSEKFSKKYGDATLTFNEETGQYEFTGVDPNVVGTKFDPNYTNKMNLARYNFRKNQINEQKNIEADLAARHQKERDFASGDVDTSQQAAADQARIDRAYREETGGEAGSYAPGGGSGEHHADESGSTYTDPFDPGGGEKDGGFIDGSNRRVPFFYGGLASMLGREGLAPGGPAGGASAGGNYGGNVNPEQEYAGSTFEERYGGGDNQNNTVVVPKTNYIDVKPKLLREDPYVDFSVMSPLEIAKLQATIGYRDIFDNDDLYAKGDLTTNIGPVTTNTQFTEEGIGNTNINWGNFSAEIDPNKNVQNIGYNNSYNGINYGVNYADGNTMFNVGTTFKNGGLATLL